MTRLAETCVNRIIEMSQEDSRIWLLDGDLADSYGATRFAEQLPDRFVMAGIAEQNMISMAAGMAALGARPFVFSFAAFLAYRGADQVRASISQSKVPVVLVGSHAGGCAGKNGKSHMATGDVALMRALPNVAVWSPCDAEEMTAIVARALDRDGAGYIRSPREPCPSLEMTAESGFRLKDAGHDVLLVASGLAVHWAVELADLLAQEGLSATVASVWQIEPFPEDLHDIIGRAATVIVIEDHVREGGLADAIATHCGRLPERCFGWAGDWTGSGSQQTLRELAGLDRDSLLAGTLEAVRPQ